MNQWDCVSAEDSNLAGTSPDYVCLITPIKLLALLKVPVIGEYAGEDAIKLGKAREKWTRNLKTC
jgi:hypothetical protein